MATKHRIIVIGLALFLVTTTSVGTAAAQCDPDFVSIKGRTVTVIPTGDDDTANLQCALDHASEVGPGATVRLAEGTFFTEQLLVRNFRGLITGAGQDKSIVHNALHPLPIDNNCIGDEPCFMDDLPSPANRYPSLVSVLNGDVTFSDLSIVVAGHYGTEMWQSWGFKIKLLSNALQMMGSHSSYRLNRVTIDSGSTYLDMTDFSFAGDAASGAILWSFSQPWFVTDSTLSVTGSTFSGSAGLFGYNLDGGRIFVRNNVVDVAGLGLAFSDIHNSQILVEGNSITAQGEGVFLWAGNIGTGIHATSLWFANNRFAGPLGISAAPGLLVDDKCEAVNNDVANVSVPYSFNGNACKVVPKR